MHTQYNFQAATISDLKNIFELYQSVSRISGGLARTPEEITEEYVRNFTEKSAKTGIQLIIVDPSQGNKVVGRSTPIN